MADINKYLHNKEDKEILINLKSNPGLITKFIKFYNGMCRKCKAKHAVKMARGHGVKESELCGVCLKKFEAIK